MGLKAGYTANRRCIGGRSTQKRNLLVKGNLSGARWHDPSCALWRTHQASPRRHIGRAHRCDNHCTRSTPIPLRGPEIGVRSLSSTLSPGRSYNDCRAARSRPRTAEGLEATRLETHLGKNGCQGSSETTDGLPAIAGLLSSPSATIAGCRALPADDVQVARTALMPFRKRAGMWRPNGVTGVGVRSDELRPLSVRPPSGTICLACRPPRVCSGAGSPSQSGDDVRRMPVECAPRDNDGSVRTCSH